MSWKSLIIITTSPYALRAQLRPISRTDRGSVCKDRSPL